MSRTSATPRMCFWKLVLNPWLCRHYFVFTSANSWKLCFLACTHCILYMSAREAFWSRCNTYFAWLYSSCKDECHYIGSMHCSYGPLVFWFIASAFESPVYYTLILLNFESWPSVIPDYWPSRHQTTRGSLGSWQCPWMIAVDYYLVYILSYFVFEL